MLKDLPPLWILYFAEFENNIESINRDYKLAYNAFIKKEYDNALIRSELLVDYLHAIGSMQYNVHTATEAIKNCKLDNDTSDEYVDILIRHNLAAYTQLYLHAEELHDVNNINIGILVRLKKNAYALRALIYEMLHKYDQAITDYFNIMNISQDNENVVKLRIAIIYYKQKKYLCALLSLDLIGEPTKNEYGYLVTKGLIYERLYNYTDSLEAYNRCILIAPTEVQYEEIQARIENITKIIKEDEVQMYIGDIGL